MATADLARILISLHKRLNMATKKKYKQLTLHDGIKDAARRNRTKKRTKPEPNSTGFIVRSITRSDRAILDRLKEHTGEATDSGAILKAVLSFVTYSVRLRTMSERFTRLNGAVDDLLACEDVIKDQVTTRGECLQSLRDQNLSLRSEH